MGAFNNGGSVVINLIGGTFGDLVESWLDLDDTPFSYIGEAGKVPTVNASETGLTFTVLVDLVGATNFLDLLDTPFNYSGEAGKFVIVNPTESGLTFSLVPASTVSTFLDLTDTPFSYVGESGTIVVVNQTETGLTFSTLLVSEISTVSTFLDLLDTPFSFAGQSGNLVHVNETGTGLTFTSIASLISTATSYLDLIDSPFGYPGDANTLVQINPTETGLTHTNYAFPTVVGTQGQALTVNNDGDLVFVDIVGETPSFLDLTDTPTTYTGASGFIPVVLPTEAGLTFASIGSLVSTATSYLDLVDSPFGYPGDAGTLVQINPTETGLTHTTFAFPSMVGTQGEVLSVDVNGNLVFTTNIAGTPTFLDLTDTPFSYVGESGTIVVVNQTETGLTFSTLLVSEISTVSTFLELLDTPFSFAGQSGNLVHVNETGTGLTFTSIASLISTATSYLDLIDSPFGYPGDAGSLVQINPTETGLTHTTFAFPSSIGTQGNTLLVDNDGNLFFGDIVGITPSFLDLTDTPGSYSGESGAFVIVEPGEAGLTFAFFPGATAQQLWKIETLTSDVPFTTTEALRPIRTNELVAVTRSLSTSLTDASLYVETERTASSGPLFGILSRSLHHSAGANLDISGISAVAGISAGSVIAPGTIQGGDFETIQDGGTVLEGNAVKGFYEKNGGAATTIRGGEFEVNINDLSTVTVVDGISSQINSGNVLVPVAVRATLNTNAAGLTTVFVGAAVFANDLQNLFNTSAILTNGKIRLFGTDNYIQRDPTTLTSSAIDINDYAFPGGNVRQPATADFTITGFDARFFGAEFHFQNISSFDITLAHESLLSLAANRILLPDSTDYVVTPNKVVTLTYDNVSTRWRVIGACATRFTDLTDVPTSYTGESGNVVTVTGSGLTFSTVASLVSTATSYLDLIDSPFGYPGDAGSLVQINPGETGLTHTTFAFPSAVGTQGNTLLIDINGDLVFGDVVGVTPSFLNLTDTPTTYTGASGFIPVVLPSEAGLTFASIGSLISTATSYLDLIDSPFGYPGDAGSLVQINPGETGLTHTTFAFPSVVGTQGDVLTVDNSGDLVFSPNVGTTPSFLDLIDTPATYVGNTGTIVVVNQAGTGLTFTSNTFADNLAFAFGGF